jgi:hypothetical protein
MVQYLDCAFLGAAISKGKKPPPQSNKPKKLKLAEHNVHSGNRGVFYAMASFALQIGRESYPNFSEYQHLCSSVQWLRGYSTCIVQGLLDYATPKTPQEVC